MREFLSALFAIAAAVSICILGMRVVTKATASGEAHRFAGLDAPTLWTSEPVRVDPRTQNYERLPSLVSVDMPAARNVTEPAAATAIDETTTGSVAGRPSFPNAHTEWCSQKYRSYRAEDNTYRSFSGKRRNCLSPYLDKTAGAVAIASQSKPDHLRWCGEPYAYQPFGGGARRPCASPRASDVRSRVELRAANEEFPF